MGVATKQIRKKIIVSALHYWPFVCIVFVWLVFSSPFLLFGKVPYPSTYQVNQFEPWSSYPEFWGAVKNGAMPDIIDQIYPWKSFTIEQLKEGKIALWNPYSFSGTPHLANNQTAVLSPLNVLFLLLPFIDAWGVLILLQPLLAGIGMLLYLRTLRLSHLGATIGSLSFMFCGFIIVWMEYGTLAYAFLFLPYALYAIEQYYTTSRYRYLVLMAITVPLSFFSGHFQTSSYFLILVVLYIFYKFLSQKDADKFLQTVLFTGVGIFLSLPQLLPSIEFYQDSFRSSVFRKIELIPITYLPTLLAPDFFGNAVTRNDWFGHYAEWNGFFGTGVFLLGIYAILRNWRKEVLFFTIIFVCALLLALDTPLIAFIITLKIPVFSTSAASRIIVLLSFAGAVLGAFGVDSIIADIRERKRRSIILWIAISTLLLALCWVFALVPLIMPVDKLSVAASNMRLPTLIVFVLLSVTVLALIIRKTPSIVFFAIVLLCLTSLDMLRFATKWIPFDPRDLVYAPVPVTKAFDTIANKGRVILNAGAEDAVYYHLPSVEGYDPLYISRYGFLIASLQNGILQEPARSVVLFPRNGLYTSQALNLLNIQYIIHKKSDDDKPWTFPYWKYPSGQFQLLWEDSKFRILENTKAFPRVFLADSYVVKKENKEIINTLISAHFDRKERVILEQDPHIQLQHDPRKSATIVSMEPTRISIRTSSKANNLLFLSNPYYPGWKATVDSTSSQLYRTDFAFSSVYVPAGKHTVTLTYDPASFRYGVYLALVGILLIPLLGFWKKEW